MNVELINTGTEILLGSVLNTHVATLAEALFALGLRMARQTTVPDGAAIGEALAEALTRSRVIIVTGGLGPTTDDLTRELTAELLERPLHEDAAVLAKIMVRFERLGIPPTPRVARQAQVPEGAAVLPNNHGTAPGLALTLSGWEVRRAVERHAPGGLPKAMAPDGLPKAMEPGSPLRLGDADPAAHLFLLPGPPRELKPMVAESVVPMLRAILAQSGVAGAADECRTYHVLGLGESNVEEAVGERLLRIPGLELGYCARPGEVDVRCIGPRAALEAAERIIMDALGPRIVARDGRSLEAELVAALTQRGETLATAESCTGGNIAHRLTNVPGASAVFIAGFVTYANEAKVCDLGVDPALLAAHGAVSPQVARAMAEGALRRAGTDWAVATTGIAGPGGGTPEKPVGTVCIALARRVKSGGNRDAENVAAGGASTDVAISAPITAQVETHRFMREREVFKDVAAKTALAMLWRALEAERGLPPSGETGRPPSGDAGHETIHSRRH